MRRLAFILAFGLSVFCSRLHATGYYGPDSYLDRGGTNVVAAPEFYWDLELKRMAREFPSPEKWLPKSDESAADAADFGAALKESRINPPDRALATRQNEAARALIDTTDEKSTASLAEELDSEFADYHRGAFAYRLGPQHWDEAREAWTKLLGRPAAERQYRTVWATFMLGKLALKRQDPEASALFRQTRELARQGFVDSLGLAAESYGWEARSEWKQGYPEKAGPLYLTQLALGDESAVVSLKALIPDRAPIEGMLNYGPEPEDRLAWTDEQKRAQEEKERAALKVAARDPLLRRLVTAHLLATSTVPNYWNEDTGLAATRSKHWLAEIKEAKLGVVRDAEYLGWAAYNGGDYKGAAYWLEVATGESPAALWLRAKLQLRAGKTADAAQSMAAAWTVIRDLAAYTGWKPVVADEKEDNSWMRDGASWTFPQEASGDLAALRGDFVQALDTFLKGRLFHDAAFVAERVLTTTELKTYVDGTDAANKDERLRYLLSRRLVREDRYEEAAPYMRAPFDKILDDYAQALRAGADTKRPKPERAAAWFHAAWLARHDGMELMGTEVAPDAFTTKGAFEINDVAKERLSGKHQTVRYHGGQETTTAVPIALPPSKEERQRLTKSKIEPDARFHYRMIAAALAMRAAELLPDRSEELADVINTAGQWVKDRDEKLGGRYLNVLERRAGGTEIGLAVAAKHWFVDKRGPWSEREREAYETMHHQLEPTKSEQ